MCLFIYLPISRYWQMDAVKQIEKYSKNRSPKSILKGCSKARNAAHSSQSFIAV